MAIQLTQLYTNNAVSTLSSVLGPSDTTIHLTSGSTFRTPGANEFYAVTLDSGTAIEVVYVFGLSVNDLTGCLRAQEGTIAQTFQPGTKVESRVTRGTLEGFSRYVDRLFNIDTVDSLDTPANSTGNSFISDKPDESGNPVVVVKANTTGLWKFPDFPIIALNGAAGTGSTTTNMVFSGGNVKIPAVLTGQFIIQFTSGVNKGLVRFVTGVLSGGITWATALPAAPSLGDTFEIYQSTSSLFTNLINGSDDGLIYAILFS